MFKTYLPRVLSEEEFFSYTPTVFFESNDTPSVTRNDSLTGLPDAGVLFQTLDAEIARAQRGGVRFAVLSCRLQGVAEVNEQEGRLAGDEMIRRMAMLLTKCCRPYDTVARMAGSEFIVVMPDLDQRNTGTRVAELRQDLAGFRVQIGAAVYGFDMWDSAGLISLAGQRAHEVCHEGPLLVKNPAVCLTVHKV